MYLFFGKGIRDGVSYISNEYSKANNKYLKSYDLKKSMRTICLDVNSLYGYAMSKFPPTSEYEWIILEMFDSDKYSNNSFKVRVLGVDFEYPKEFRELPNDYYSAPNKIEITKEMIKMEIKKEVLSIKQSKIPNFYNTFISNVKKLVHNFFDKQKYVLHYENLPLSLRLRLKLKNTSCIRIQSMAMA